MSEERNKKSEAAWKATEDDEFNKSGAFVDLVTEYIASAVENDTHFFLLAALHKLYSLDTFTYIILQHL